LSHEVVTEQAVIGAPDKKRGASVQAHVVLTGAASATPGTAKSVQDHAKRVSHLLNFHVGSGSATHARKIPASEIRHFLMTQKNVS